MKNKDEAIIKNDSELEFAIFCIENAAIRLSLPAEKIYELWTVKSDILNSYIVPCFDILHTQGKDYIVDDILEVMKKRGIFVLFYTMARIK